MKKTGAEILIDALAQEGVDVLFAFPGGQVIPIFNALYDAKDLKIVLVRHEQAAAHAAEGYARATGKVGVCLATSGPGATNLITGIADAYMDSIPIVAINGHQRPRRHEPGDGDRHGVHGQLGAGGDHRAGADQSARQRRISGGRPRGHFETRDQT